MKKDLAVGDRVRRKDKKSFVSNVEEGIIDEILNLGWDTLAFVKMESLFVDGDYLSLCVPVDELERVENFKIKVIRKK